MTITLPFDMQLWQLIGLCAVSFTAGLIDAIAGGGGLIQLPGVMTFLPNVPVVTLLSINKTSSMFGTITSMVQYGKSGLIDWKRMWKIALCAFCTAALGAFTAKRIPNELLKPLIIILLAFLVIFTIFKKDFGAEETVSRFTAAQQSILGLILGLVMGFYDGFFGPGTGNFLIMGLIFIYGLDFLHASANAKVVNGMTNLSAFLMYMFLGIGNLFLGVIMGIFNMLGARLGVRLAVLKGSKFIRVLFIVMSTALLINQLIDMF